MRVTPVFTVPLQIVRFVSILICGRHAHELRNVREANGLAAQRVLGLHIARAPSAVGCASLEHIDLKVQSKPNFHHGTFPTGGTIRDNR
jgi:hypothetical protein